MESAETVKRGNCKITHSNLYLNEVASSLNNAYNFFFLITSLVLQIPLLLNNLYMIIIIFLFLIYHNVRKLYFHIFINKQKQNS